jgi:hypothetical protein
MHDNKLLGIYLSRILSGFFIFFCRGEKYKLIYPDISIKYEAEIYALEEYEKNKFNDWIHDDSIIDALVSMGVWTYNGDINLTSLEKQIEDLKVDLYNNVLNPNQIKNIRKTLNNVKNTYNKQYNLRHSLDSYTPYGYSETLKNYYILVHSIYDKNNLLVFKDINNVDFQYFENLSSIIIENTIDIPLYKQIARSDIWKNYWSANSDNLFSKSTIDWTDEQKTLVVLTKMYDSAYQHPECPPDNVFQDDDMFEGWMIHQKRENEKLKNKQKTEKMLEGKKLNKAGEIFLVANSQEEANNIYGLNDNTQRHIIKERNQIISRTPDQIDASKLPDAQRELINQINEKIRK